MEEGEGELGVARIDGLEDGTGGAGGSGEELGAGGFGEFLLPGVVDLGKSGVGVDPAPEGDAGDAGPFGGVGVVAAVGQGGEGELLIVRKFFELRLIVGDGEILGHGAFLSGKEGWGRNGELQKCGIRKCE